MDRIYHWDSDEEDFIDERGYPENWDFSSYHFIECCERGDIDGAEYTLKMNPNINITRESGYALNCACNEGHLDVVKWIIRKVPDVDIWDPSISLFESACEYGHLDIVKWIYAYSKRRRIIPDGIVINTAFRKACRNGYLHICKCLLEFKPDINISTDNVLAFATACMNISAKNEEMFRDACKTGDLDFAKWLLRIKSDINISTNDEEAFRFACFNGHLKLAQWLLQVKPNINISAGNEHAFRRACAYGCLDVAQWMTQVCPTINISAENDEAFRDVCRRPFGVHLNVAKWLQSLKPYLYVIEYDENGKYKGYKIREKEESNWQRRKYLVWLASNDCPKENKHNLLYKLPSDVSRMAIGFV